MAQNYPPAKLTSQALQRVQDAAIDWAFGNGLVVRAPADGSAPNASSYPRITIPALTLYPSPFPKTLFEQAKNIQLDFNKLYAEISSNEGWLRQVLQEVSETDDFVKKLWETHDEARKSLSFQSATLGLFRSDYMIDTTETPASLRQVEFNTIASSFAGLADETASLHRYLATANLDAGHDSADRIPENGAALNLAMGICAAYDLHGSKTSPETAHSSRCVLVIHQPGERNIYDQRKIEFKVDKPIFRLSFDQVNEKTRLDSRGHLIYADDGRDYVVSVVYWRAGYTPDDYNFDRSWEARLLVEKSSAIKSPDVLTQLAGTKKVQQVLATPGSKDLSTFVGDERSARLVADTFVPIYPLDKSEAGQTARELALNPDSAIDYVLKPQREGGGNNIYKENIPPYLKKLAEKEWGSYILMKLIKAPSSQHNHILRTGKLYSGRIICELGIYGMCIWERNQDWTGTNGLSVNDYAGYLVRSKPDSSDEGGIAAGFGCLDSCLLV